MRPPARRGARAQEAALTTSDPRPTPVVSEDAEAVVDLLGVLAYGVLVAFDRLAEDARLAPDLHRRAALSEMAAAEMSE